MASDDENDEYVTPAERKAKQNFLNEEVLELGYDPELFMDFISKTKDPDIDLWSFDELQAAVSAFKSKYRPGDVNTSPAVQPTRKSVAQASPAPVSQISTPVENIPSAPAEEIKLDTTLIKSKGVDKNPLTECPEITLKVSEPQVTGGGVFSKKYVVYTVTCLPLGWSVKRRYSDFLWLREALCACYLSSYLPPIPPKKTTGSLEEKTIFKRQLALNQFMVVLSMDKLILGSPLVLGFLQETDDSKFKRIVKNHKVRKTETVEQTFNYDSQAFVEYSDCSKVYDAQMNYVVQSELLKKKIKQKCSQLMEDDRKLSESLRKYADLIKELQEVQRKIPNNESTESICASLHESLVNWSVRETENIIDINKDIRIPFSCSYKEMAVLKELLRERESLYMHYRKLEAKQKPDKPRDLLERAKEMYGYSNHKTQREVERVILDETKLAFAHFHHSAQHQADRVTVFHQIWGTLMSKLVDMKFEDGEGGEGGVQEKVETSS